MSDSIREQIIQYILTTLAEIRTINGYHTDLGIHIERVRTRWGTEELPSLSVFPGTETSELQFGQRVSTLPITIIANHLIPVNTNPSIQAEKLLADIIHNILGPTFTLTFTHGSKVIVQGNTIAGATSLTTAIILSCTLTSGQWSKGTAAGTLRIRDMRGSGFTPSESLTVCGVIHARCATVPVIQTRYGDLLSRIEYTSGGPESYPDPGETVIAVRTIFNFIYPTLNDNPYLQR